MQDFSDLSAILFVEPLMATHCLNALDREQISALKYM